MLNSDSFKVIPLRDEGQTYREEWSQVKKSDDAVKWLSILLSKSDNILRVDDSKFTDLSSLDLADIEESLLSKTPFVVTFLDSDGGRSDTTLLHWVGSLYDRLNDEESNLIVTKTALTDIADRYIHLIENEIDYRVSEKVFTTHILSLIEFAYKCNSVSNAILKELIDLFEKRFEDIYENYSNTFCKSIYLMSKYFRELFIFNDKSFAERLLVQIDNQIKKESGDSFDNSLNKLSFYSVVYDKTLMIKLFFSSDIDEITMDSAVVILTRSALNKYPSNISILESAACAMDALKADAWIEVLFTLVSHPDGGLTSIAGLVRKDDACISRTVRKSKCVDKKDVFSKNLVRINFSYSVSLNQYEWLRLFDDLSAVSKGILDYNPSLYDIFNVAQKNENYFLLAINERVSDDLFKINFANFMYEIRSIKYGSMRANISSNIVSILRGKLLILLKHNVSSLESNASDDIYEYLKFVLSLKSSERVLFSESIILYMEENNLDDLPSKAINDLVNGKSKAIFVIKKLNSDPYYVMSNAEKDSVKQYCMELLAKG